MNIKKSFALGAITTTLLVGCGSPAILLSPETNTLATTQKTTELSDAQLKHWGHSDLVTDTIPGMSVEKAYDAIFNTIKDLQPTTVIVGVLDSGVDIEHDDLKNVIWVNEDEIPGNNIDDDNNGFVDDVHGWNFLGEANHEQLEYVRIVSKGDDGSDLYKRAKEEYEKEYDKTLKNKTRYEQIMQNVTQADALLQEALGKEIYTLEDLEQLESEDEQVLQAKAAMSQMLAFEDSVEALKEEIKGGVDYFAGRLNYHLNVDYDGRSIVGDDPENIEDTDYGNNDVMGDRDHSKHGTHVAGIIAAERNNGIGMNGVADHVKIMSVRTVPDGDEYDKDVALAIRYAVDNGAKVINGSFGKYFSPNKQWVWDAIKYAASKDVLIIKAAGNEGLDLDENNVYPNDNENNGEEISDNFLTVGALSPNYGTNLIASFSNYGKDNVDVFAPGVKIYSTTPSNEYEYLQGTSMAAPEVAGVAALIRSYFPKLKAAQVKKIIMQSGLTTNINVSLGGNPNYTKPFGEVSKSGKMVNLYNAMILADQVANGKLTL